MGGSRVSVGGKEVVKWLTLYNLHDIFLTFFLQQSTFFFLEKGKFFTVLVDGLISQFTMDSTHTQGVTPMTEISIPSSSSSSSAGSYSSSSSSSTEKENTNLSEEQPPSLQIQQIQEQHQKQLQEMQQQYQQQLLQIQQQQQQQQELMHQMQQMQQQQLMLQKETKPPAQAANTMQLAMESTNIVPIPAAEKGSAEEALDILRGVVSLAEGQKHVLLPPPSWLKPPTEEEIPQAQKSCFICGNIRKKRITCARIRCPRSYCSKCHVKAMEKFGGEAFMNGCPICKRLCVCTTHSSKDLKLPYCGGICLTVIKDQNMDKEAESISSQLTPQMV